MTDHARFAMFATEEDFASLVATIKPFMEALDAHLDKTYAHLEDKGTPQDNSGLRLLIAGQVLLRYETERPELDDALPGVFGLGAACGALAGHHMVEAGRIFNAMAAGFQRQVSLMFNTFNTQGNG